MGNDYDECDLILLEMMSIWKNVLYYFKFLGLLWELVTLCLPIPLVPVMYPWVWVVTPTKIVHVPIGTTIEHFGQYQYRAWSRTGW